MSRNFKAELPIRFTDNIVGMHAEPGRQWLADLPNLITETAVKWSLEVCAPFADLSYNYVAPCVCADGTKAVLKLGFPEKDSVNFSEVKMLDLMAGDVVVKLLNFDRKLCAMLLERALPGENLIGICKKNDERATEIAIGVMKGFWQAAPEKAEFVNLEKWTESLRRFDERIFPLASLKTARNYFTELIVSSRKSFLLHGDLHHGNILSAQREPFLAIDPKGIIGDIGYEISVFLNNPRSWVLNHPHRESILRKRIEMFAREFEIEPENLRKWAYAEAILSAWWTMEDNCEGWEKWLAYAEVWETIKI